MKRKTLDRFLERIDECVNLQEYIEMEMPINIERMSQPMRDSLIGFAIERKNELINRLAAEGVIIDEDV